MYFGLFIASISTAGFSSIMISPHAGLPLFVFFPIKSLLSAVIFFAFVADTGLMLMNILIQFRRSNFMPGILWLFRMEHEVNPFMNSRISLYGDRYVKVYIHKKREANGGWPLPYGLNPYR